jgi:hypothetical protein
MTKIQMNKNKVAKEENYLATEVTLLRPAGYAGQAEVTEK